MAVLKGEAVSYEPGTPAFLVSGDTIPFRKPVIPHETVPPDRGGKRFTGVSDSQETAAP